MDRRAGAAAVVGAAVLWGTAGTVQELALPATSPVVVAGLRSLLGGLVLTVLLLARGRVTVVAATVRSGRGALVAAALAMLVFQVGYLEGIRRAGIAVGTLAAIGSAPVWAGLLALVRGRRPSVRWAVATGVAVAGLTLLLAGDLATATLTAGIVAALVAGAGYAAAATATAVLVGRGIDRIALVAVIFVACAAVLLPAVVVLGLGPDPTPERALLGLAWLGLATIALAYVLFATGLRTVDAPAATTLTLAEPLTATGLAVLVAGERLTSWAGIGAAILLVGLVLSPSRAARDA